MPIDRHKACDTAFELFKLRMGNRVPVQNYAQFRQAFEAGFEAGFSARTVEIEDIIKKVELKPK